MADMGNKERLDSKYVEELVRVAHGNLDRVKEIVAEQPALVNCAWDWGGGDWETPLGAAAHTGRREIALFLLANGARLDIFAAAMLGRLEIVRAAIEAFPAAAATLGPHGIPLKAHAEAGGPEATVVLEYLEELPIGGS
jgi:hypothetical protein